MCDKSAQYKKAVQAYKGLEVYVGFIRCEKGPTALGFRMTGMSNDYGVCVRTGHGMTMNLTVAQAANIGLGDHVKSDQEVFARFVEQKHTPTLRFDAFRFEFPGKQHVLIPITFHFTGIDIKVATDVNEPWDPPVPHKSAFAVAAGASPAMTHAVSSARVPVLA